MAVFLWTAHCYAQVHSKNKGFVNCMFILAWNYKVFMVDMDSVVQADLHFNEELQRFRGGHGFLSSSESSF